jgi:hypothetical protein
LLGFATSACALTGYGFDDYERGEPTAASEPTALGGEPNTSVPFDVTLATTAAGGEKPNDGADSRGGAGGDPMGSGSDAANRAAGAGAGAACRPQTCLELGLECGESPQLPNGCGTPVDCGACFWWFQRCRQNRCVISE